MAESAREALPRLAERRGTSLAALSVMLGRNVAYLQQFVVRGTPRRLAEDDRRVLAQFLGVEETVLGGTVPAATVAVPYLSVAASAGPGTAVADERVVRVEHFAAATLAAAGIARHMASIIDAAGDSMAPTIHDGDRLLVDRADRDVARRGAVFVLRREGELVVKRVSLAGGGMRVASDNADYPTLTCPAGEVTIVGRVKLLLRVPE